MRLVVGVCKSAPKGYFNLGQESIPEAAPDGWISCLCDNHADAAGKKWGGGSGGEEGT
jgi:hypothetical protein